VYLHEVLGGVVSVFGNEFSVWAADIIKVVLLKDVAARRLGNDNVGACADLFCERCDVFLRNLGELLDITSVKPRCTTASGFGVVAFNAVTFIYLDEVLTDVSLLVLNETGRINSDTALAIAEADLWTLSEPRGKSLLGVGR
jgi:hypothetical protein